jgi:hypothetical protein
MFPMFQTKGHAHFVRFPWAELSAPASGGLKGTSSQLEQVIDENTFTNYLLRDDSVFICFRSAEMGSYTGIDPFANV